MLFSIFLTKLWALGPSSDSLIKALEMSSLKRLYDFEVEILVKYSLRAPTFGSIDIQLSFKITNRLEFSMPA